MEEGSQTKLRRTDPIKQSKVPTDGKQGSKNRHFAKDSDLCKWDLKQTLPSDCQPHKIFLTSSNIRNLAITAITLLIDEWIPFIDYRTPDNEDF